MELTPEEVSSLSLRVEMGLIQVLYQKEQISADQRDLLLQARMFPPEGPE